MRETQERWDTVYGTEGLRELERNPERFLVPDNPTLTPKRSLVLQEVVGPGVQSVVEFGSGQGRFGVVLARSRGLNVTGIDIGPELVEMANQVAKMNGVQDRCKFICGSITDTKLTGLFDAVAGISILHHLPPDALIVALREANRLLRPGCRAVFSEPIENSGIFNALQNLFPAGRPGAQDYRPSMLNRRAWVKYVSSRDDRPLTTRELSCAAQQAGFKVTRTEYVGLISRLKRVFPRSKSHLTRIDGALLKMPLLKRYAQSVVITLTKVDDIDTNSHAREELSE